MIDRYSRQTIFGGIGVEGQKRLGEGYAVVVGCGALGSIIASSLVCAGVGKVRIIDRDTVEYHNLHRQILYDEDDVRSGLPKAIAAEQHLKKANSSVEIEGIAADVNPSNIEGLVTGADIILDGLDNLETRFVVNEVSLKHRIPWVYGGVIASMGRTMTIIPGQTPCFRCISVTMPDKAAIPTCGTAGVINPAPFIIGSMEAAEAMKMLVGAGEINRDFIAIDVWKGSFVRLKIGANRDCPVCQGRYELLEGAVGLKTTSLCGQNAVQLMSPRAEGLSLAGLAARLQSVGKVSYNDFMLRLEVGGHEMVVFPDGRAIVKNTTDESLARELYTRYIGK